MKHLDWKSFAIGIFLTSTVVFGVAATNPTFGKQWNETQKWQTKLIKMDDTPQYDQVKGDRDSVVGWEFVGIESMGDASYLIYRKPVSNWPVLLEIPKGHAFPRNAHGKFGLKGIYP